MSLVTTQPLLGYAQEIEKTVESDSSRSEASYTINTDSSSEYSIATTSYLTIILTPPNKQINEIAYQPPLTLDWGFEPLLFGFGGQFSQVPICREVGLSPPSDRDRGRQSALSGGGAILSAVLAAGLWDIGTRV